MSKENLALVNIPVSMITLLAPILIRDTRRQLTWFTRTYVLYLISAIPTAIYVYSTPQILSKNYYYLLLIVLLTINEFVLVLRFAAQVGFFAAISDPRIGGTYMTFLVTINNLGFALNSSIILYLAEYLPKAYAYVISVALCFFLGMIWFFSSYRTLMQLEHLPTKEWYLKDDYFKNERNAVTLSNDEVHDEMIVSGA